MKSLLSGWLKTAGFYDISSNEEYLRDQGFSGEEVSAAKAVAPLSRRGLELAYDDDEPSTL